MSYKPSWHTKEDIMQDLVVMGQMNNIDEGYLVTGEKPPPPRLEFEDDEMDLRFGGISNDGQIYQTEKPDLQGITKFLRMVNDDDSQPKELPDDEIIIVKPNSQRNQPDIKNTNALKTGIKRNVNPKAGIKSNFKELPDEEMINVKPNIQSNSGFKPDTKNIISPKPDIKRNLNLKTGVKSNFRKLADEEIIIVKPNIQNNDGSKPDTKNTISPKLDTKRNLNPKTGIISILDVEPDDIKNNIAPIPVIKSNLDPTVAEFVPKSAHSSIVSNMSDIEKTNKPNGVFVLTDTKYVSDVKNVSDIKNVINVKISTDIDLNKKVDVTQLNQKEKDNISAKLRDRISDTLSADSPQLKKERNVAIANLIKLHSSQARPSTSATELHTDAKNTITLHTPDYYKRSAKFSPTGSNTQRSTPSNDLKKTRMNESNSATPEPVLNSNSEPVLPSSSSATPEQTKDISLNSSMEESINKVNKWLDGPESPRPKAPPVCLTPMSFKKKIQSPNHAKSPVNVTEQKRIQTTAVYRPSKYADDLGKKYLERSKVKEAQSGERGWLPIGIEEELKARDEKIKKKQKTNETPE